MQKNNRYSYRYKDKGLRNRFALIIFIVSVSIVLALCIFTGIRLSSISNFAHSNMEERLLSVSRYAAELVTADELNELWIPEDMEKPIFAELRRRIADFVEENDVMYVYYKRNNDDNMAQYIVEGDLTDGEENLSSEPIEWEEKAWTALIDKVAVAEMDIYLDEYWNVISAFAPVFDKDGQVAAVVGVDIDDKQIVAIHETLDILVPLLALSVLIVIGCGSLNVYLHRQATRKVERHNKLTEAVNQAAALLLNSDFVTFERAVYLSMQKIADVLKVDCVYLWKNQVVDGQLYCFQVFEWSPQETMFADGKLYNYNEVVPGWDETLSKGDTINSLVRDMSEKEQEHLSPSGILSILVVPIFFEDQFWGFVGYDDCHRERLFTNEEESILHSGSLLIANSFVRNEQIQLMLDGIDRERNLEIQKQAAQAANDAKTQFLASMSHEIRTPMNAIIGMSDLLLAEDLNIRQHRYAEDIRLSGLSLLGIINDILDLSKIQAAKLSLIPVHYSIKVLIENISSMVLFLIQDKGKHLTFRAELQDGFPECLYGDDVRLRQVLLNLLSNAVKFTKEGSVILAIGASGSNMHVTVTDSGEGIPEDELPTLFDAFEQADMQKHRHQQGTGLGLAITKSLVELMDGHISVESVYGKGTSFHIVVPLVPGDETLIKKDNEDADLVYAPDANVLVVDDKETNLTVICGLLHHSHIIADKAVSGAKAIEMVRAKQYDLIFMDHMMPEMDGIETTRNLRDMGVTIPIIALTANAVSGARELLLSVGMDDFLSKPIDKAELYRILREWIPVDKITRKPDTPERDTAAVNITEDEQSFWNKIHKVKGLSAEIGLEIVDGQFGVYKDTLEIAIRELKKSMEHLNKFMADKKMRNFCTEVHGTKGSLSLIGARELSLRALKLENASREDDVSFCNANLSDFLNELSHFIDELQDAFSELRKNQENLTIPPELPPILVKLSDAMGEMDFDAVFHEVDLLSALELTGTIKDEVESLIDAVQIMNYDYAADIIERLLGQTKK